MLKIGDFSKLSRVSIRMLRHYDEIGLLKPAVIDRFTGYRYYSEAQLPVICRITACEDMGFSLSEIREMLAVYDDREKLMAFLTVRQEELNALLADTQHKLRLLDTAQSRLRKEQNMRYNVTIKTLPERYAATVRMVIPNYEQEGMLWNILMEETANQKLIDGDPCYCCAVFHDKEYREEQVDVEVQKDVKGRYDDTEHVRFKTLPAVTVASAVFNGGYEQMNEVTAAIAAWIDANGYEYDGATFNIYHVSPHETANPDEFVTEVCYPIRKK